MGDKRVARLLVSMTIGLALSLMAPEIASPVHAAGGQAHVRTVAMTFRLHVVGNLDQNATYWVAYGPIDGQFGLVRLQVAGSERYQAVRRVAIGARSVFAFLEGQGTIRTRFGPAPGNPVVTIKRLGPMTVGSAGISDVRWRAPAG